MQVDVLVNVLADVVTHSFFGLVMSLLFVAYVNVESTLFDLVVDGIREAFWFCVPVDCDGVTVEIEKDLQRSVHTIFRIPKMLKAATWGKRAGHTIM